MNPDDYINGIHKSFYADTYSHPDLHKLCADCGIENPDIAYIKERLETFAAIYRKNESGKNEPRPTNAELRKELEKVSKQTGQLLETLTNVDWRNRNELDKGPTYDAWAASSGKGAAPEIPSLVIPNFPEVIGEEPTSYQIINLQMMIALLGGLKRAADTGGGSYGKLPTGRRWSMGLHVWVSNVRDLWHEITAKPFTRNATNDGQPLTAASMFCSAAMCPLDPAVKNPAINGAMQSNIHRHKEAADRISAQNES